MGAGWLLASDGRGASNPFESGGFIRSRVGVRYPDIQFHFLPLAVNYDGSALAREHGFQAHVGPMRSQSQGWVRLRSEEHTSELQSRLHLVCRLLLEKKKTQPTATRPSSTTRTTASTSLEPPTSCHR